MPMSDIGSLLLHHVVFLTHLVYINLAFSHAEPNLLVLLYLLCKVFARRPEDLDLDPSSWPPSTIPKW